MLMAGRGTCEHGWAQGCGWPCYGDGPLWAMHIPGMARRRAIAPGLREPPELMQQLSSYLKRSREHGDEGVCNLKWGGSLVGRALPQDFWHVAATMGSLARLRPLQQLT